TRKIIDMVHDVRSALKERIKMSRCFLLQLDESTDVADLANLQVYIRYGFEGMSHEDFLFCKPLPTRTIQESIFAHGALHSEVQMFLHIQQSPLASLFDDPVWLVQLAYLADIFKAAAFVNKIKAGNVSAFPTLKNHLHTYGVALDAAVCDVIVLQLLSLEEQFSEYFPVEATPKWVRNPFTVDVTGIPEDLSLVPDIARLSSAKQAHPSH
ncbi:ZBED5 protein, partial [Amia calva]|nr:ZBED5 protein [Amia calva]